MKRFLFLLLVLVLASCSSPTSVKLPTYTPPSMSAAKDMKVLRAPDGYSLPKGLAENDPLAGACNEPGTVYMFYDDNALVQYIPFTGGYLSLADAAKITVESHNSLHPSSPWDFISVTPPGPIVDTSHDQPCPVLHIQFVDHHGNVVKDYDMGDAAYYHQMINNGAVQLSWELYNGQRPTDDPLHILYGGDGT